MVIMTGSNPKALVGGEPKISDAPNNMPGKAIPRGGAKDEEAGSSSGGDYSREFLACQEKGYSPRKGMAAGLCKC